MKKICFVIALILLSITSYSQKQDTVVVNLGKTSKIIFTMGDPEDLEVLRHYNFDQLFSDILEKLEAQDKKRTATPDSLTDSTKNTKENESIVIVHQDGEESQMSNDDDHDNENNDDNEWNKENRHHHYHDDWQSFNFDLGTNNYLADGKFPDDSKPYAVRPWGSWYVGLSSVQRARLGKNFFLEWGLGVNWYNFKFEKDNISMSKDETGVIFDEDNRDLDFNKSKLTVSYVMTSLVPVIDFNNNNYKARFWDGNKDAFRIGLGPYAAYRIGSHSKLVYEEEDKIKNKNYDSFYLNNFRYGLRFQVGYRSTDLFVNYDLNELFISGKGPDLNAISFGIIF